MNEPRRHFLIPVWLHVLGRNGRLGLLSLLYMRRRLEEIGLYPGRVGDSAIVQLIEQRQAAWHKPMRWDAGEGDVAMRNPEGVKTWLNKDIHDFRRLCAGEVDPQLAHSHAHAAMVRTGRMKTLTP